MMNRQFSTTHLRYGSSLLIVLIVLISFFLSNNYVYCKIRLSSKEEQKSTSTTSGTGSYVPVYIMMPLDTVNNDGTLNNPTKIYNNLKQVKQVGTDGIMIDVWWGIVEGLAPNIYNFTAYVQLFTMCQQLGLKVEPVMSFHQCGTNVGDAAYIPLPKWVLQVGQSNPDIFYTDQNGHRDREYLSLGVDNVAIFPSGTAGKNRTAVDMYSDYMNAFMHSMSSFINSGVIGDIEVGLGPAGEMRYPSYQLQNNLWTFPGVGAFQCYDKYMLKNLSQSAAQVGHADWGYAGPDDAGYYNSFPYQTGFFSENTVDNYNSPYGKFFLSWYSGQLIQHGANILSRARNIFGKNVRIAGKIAGIHWWFFSSSHAAELTAGYYNTAFNDGYGAISQMFAQYDVDFEFTCMEMVDNQQPSNCACGPQELVAQTRATAWKYGLDYGGENALDIEGNYQANSQIIKQSFSNGKAIAGFTYLRMTDTLFAQGNFNAYAQLVSSLHNLSSSASYEKVESIISNLKKQINKQ